MTNLWQQSALELARLIREGEVSSEEVVGAFLTRIGEVNPAINGLGVIDGEGALEAARKADQALASGVEVGPLHGVPFAVQANVDVAGSVTSLGVVSMAESRSPFDAPSVARFRSAGAIPLGRTNMADFGLRWQTDNDLYGLTRNPWQPDLSAGGSGGGGAAAVATGMVPLALGNDYGGSLRLSSAWCGVTAMRPTLGRVSGAATSLQNEPLLTGQLFSVQGPVVGTVDDLRLALELLSTEIPRNPLWSSPQIEPEDVPRRIAYTFDPGGLEIDPSVARGIATAVTVLADAGYEMEEVEPPPVRESMDLWAQLVLAEIRTLLYPQIRELCSAGTRRFLEMAQDFYSEMDLAGYMIGLANRYGHLRRWTEFHEEYPLLLCAASTLSPVPHDFDIQSTEQGRAMLHSLRLTVTANLLGLPALVMPVGVEEGLPQSVQIIGPRGGEELCLRAASILENELGPISPPDLKRTGE